MEINPFPEENEIELDFIEELYEENNEIMPLQIDSSFINLRNTAKRKSSSSDEKL